MATQAIRNIIRTSIDKILPEAEKRLREEGNKKIEEISQKLTNPQEIIKILGADIDPNTCSIEGRNKFKEKADKLIKGLHNSKEIITKGITAIQTIEDKIAPITDRIELPEGAIGPIEKINQITTAIGPIMNGLQKLIIAAPSILSALSGPAANGLLITKTADQLSIAKAKISEFTQLINTAPQLLNQYKNLANSVATKITDLKNKIQPILNKIDELEMFILYLELKFEKDCNDQASSGTDNPQLEPPISPPPITLAELINQAEKLYGDLLNDLIARGDNYGIRRVYVLGEQFQRIKNTRIDNLGPGFAAIP